MTVTGWRRELMLALGWGTVLFALTMVPYLVGYLTAPPGKVFNGFFFLGDDGSTYIAKMRAGANGAWGWSDAYISTPVAKPVPIYLFYIGWGKLAGLLHIPLFVAFHLARLSGAVVLVLAARRLAAAALPPGRVRLLAVVLALVGSGAGYLLALASAVSGRTELLGQPLASLDLHVPEISGFFSLMTFPHFTWAAALMTLSVVDLMGVASAPSWSAGARAMVLATIFMVGVVLIHPQMVVIPAMLAVAMVVAYRPPPRRWPALAVPFLVAAPLLAYYVYIGTTDPVVSAWARQWREEAFPILPTIFALGLPLVLAVVAVVGIGRRLSPVQLVLAAWVGLVLVLLYVPSPVHVQRRLVEGIYLPLGVLAALAVDRLARPGAGLRAWPRLAAYSAAVCAFSSILVLMAPLLQVTSRQDAIYLDASEARAMDWMATQVGPGTPAAVMSTADTGLFIPARAGDRVFVGHYAETIDSGARRAAAAAGIRSGGATLTDLMRSEGTTMLFIGPRERASGVGPIDPALSLVYDRDGVQVYVLTR